MYRNKTVNFTCYDAGAAEIISNFIKAKKIKNYNLILGKITKNIFLRNKVSLKTTQFSKIIKKSDIFITGTSWKYNYELEMIKKIKKLKNKKTIIMLDDFVNLKKRFLLKNKYIFPDEIWIPNNLPRNRIDLSFLSKSKIRFIDNYYLINIKKKLKNLKNNKFNKKNYLFLSQPIREVSNKFTSEKIIYDEIDYFKKILIKMNKLFHSGRIKLISIRLHPAEKKNKYRDLIKKFKNLPIRYSKESRINDLKKHYFVFGMNTNAMKIALLNKNIVISLLSKRKIDRFFYDRKVLSFYRFK